MRKLVFLIACVAQAQNLNYYGGFTSGVRASLFTPVGIADTSISVRNGTCFTQGINTACTSVFASNMLIQLDSETMQICTVTTGPGQSTILNLGHNSCPNIDGRAFGGTTAAAHAIGANVVSVFTSYSYNAILTQLTNTTSPCLLDTLYTSLTAAITATPTGGCLNITGIYSGAFTFSGTNQIFNFYPGSTVQANSNTAPITITGTNLKITGLTVDGRNSQSAYTGSGIVVNGATGITLKSTTVTNTGAYGIYVPNSSNITIETGTINTTAADPIFVQDNVTGLIIREITASSTTAVSMSHTIGIHVITAAAVMSKLLIEHNDLTCGGTAANFCIEIGNFISGLPSGQDPTDVKVIDNSCTFSGGTTNGCVSLQAVDHAVVTGNILNGNNLTVGLEFIELVCSSYVSAAHNKMFNVSATNLGGMNFDGTNHSSIIDNDIAGIIQSGRTNPGCLNYNYNTIANNRVIIPASAVVVRAGIWLQSNVANGDGSKQVITGNTIIGNGQALIDGITLEVEFGNIDTTVISNNICVGLRACVGRGTVNGTLTNTIMIGNLPASGVLDESGYDTAPYNASTIRLNSGGSNFLPNTLYLQGSVGTGTNSNNDLAGFATLGGAGTFTLTWPSGHSYTVGPGCTASGYDATGIIRAQANATGVTFTSSVGAADSGKLVQYICLFHVF